MHRKRGRKKRSTAGRDGAWLRTKQQKARQRIRRERTARRQSATSPGVTCLVEFANGPTASARLAANPAATNVVTTLDDTRERATVADSVLCISLRMEEVSGPMISAEFRFTAPPSSCPYLSTEVSRLDYRLIPELDDARYAGLLNRGWRRFGYQFFRPHCPACARCRSLRVKVAEFQPNKAQRRALARNRDVRLEVRPANVSDAHVDLYNRYHRFMTTAKGWREQTISKREYVEHFLGGRFSFGFDFLYFLGENLVAVGLVDVTVRASSSAYFFHEPSLRLRSLGTFSMLKELEYARERRIPHHHLGYWVPECPSMVYKGTYRPMELLVGYPRDAEEPEWVDEEDWRPVLNREEPEEPL